MYYFFCLIILLAGITAFALSRPKKVNSNKIAKPVATTEKVANMPSLYKNFLKMHDYFYAIGLISEPISEYDARGKTRKQIITHYVHPLLLRIVNQSPIDIDFKESMHMYDTDIYLERTAESMVQEITHIYNEIRKNEGLFYLIIKYQVKYDFIANLDHDVSSELLQKKAVDKLKNCNLSDDDKALLIAYYGIDDPDEKERLEQLEQSKNELKNKLYSKIEKNKVDFHENLHEGAPVDTFIEKS